MSGLAGPGDPPVPTDSALLRVAALGVLVGPPERRVMAVRDITQDCR